MDLATVFWFILAALAGYWGARVFHLTGAPHG